MTSVSAPAAQLHRLLGVILACAMGLPAGASALDLNAGLGLALRTFDDDAALGRAPGQPPPNLGLAPGLDLRFGARPLEWLAVEVEALLLFASEGGGGGSPLIGGVRGHAGLAQDHGERWSSLIYLGGGLDALFADSAGVATSDRRGLVYGGGGVAWAFLPQWRARVDGRLVVAARDDGLGVASFEGVLGVEFLLGEPKKQGPLDADADGVLDAVDVCPYEPETRNGYRDEDGCPEHPDTVPAATLPDAPTASALPASASPSDAAHAPARVTGLPPLVPERDSDGDGLMDDDDLCPNAAEDKDGFQDGDGCPEPDNDEDGVADGADKCPNTAENHNGYRDDDGCPDLVPKALKRFAGTVSGISFERGAATIRSRSLRVLRAALKTLRRYKSLQVEVHGHTDNSGNRKFNIDLSQQRAESVRQWLIRNGIDAGRLSARGFGPDKPVADNKDKAGQARNRRVEFVLTDTTPAAKEPR